MSARPASLWRKLSPPHAASALSVSAVFFAVWLLSMPAYCLIRLWGPASLLDVATAVVAGSLFAFSLTHAIESRGWRRALLMLGVAVAIALLMEYLGSAHSILFGDYDYTSRLGPKAFGQVPIIIPVAWFMMLYPAWETAGLLVARFYTRKRSIDEGRSVWPAFVALFLRVSVAALAMTAWDLSLDPRMAADGAWVWHGGGEYFGIPLTNFLGWIVTSAMIYAVWARIEHAELEIEKTSSQFSILNSQFLPVIAYIVQWLGESMANALFWGGLAVAACVFVAMGLFAVPAALALKNKKPRG